MYRRNYITNLKNIGILLSDASFNKKNGSGIIGVINKETKQTWQKPIIAKNPTDAEIQGLEYAMEISLKEGYRNTIFICDNKEAIENSMKKAFITLSRSSQWLWLPRDYLDAADLLTKVIDKDTAEKFKAINKKNRDDKRAKQNLQHVNQLRDNTKYNDISNLLKELKILLVDYNFKSMFMKLIQNGNEDIKLLSNCILEEIEVIEKDQHSIKLGSLSRIGVDTIIDLLILL